MKKILRLMTDYHCFPLWESIEGGVKNWDPEELPLSDDLRDELKEWAETYDATLNVDDPLESGFKSTEDAEAFESRGRDLWRELQQQLGYDYEISYFSGKERKLLSSDET
jgi:hypothetical protein